jgi:hypothetical protein
MAARRGSMNSFCGPDRQARDPVRKKRTEHDQRSVRPRVMRANLRQKFRVDIELEIAGLLNAQQEPKIESRAVCQRCGECHRARRHR